MNTSDNLLWRGGLLSQFECLPAEDLQPGDVLYSSDGRYHVIQTVAHQADGRVEATLIPGSISGSEGKPYRATWPAGAEVTLTDYR